MTEFLPARKNEEPTDEERGMLVGLVAVELASRGSTQYEVARYGFRGVLHMDAEAFWDCWECHTPTEEDMQEYLELQREGD